MTRTKGASRTAILNLIYAPAILLGLGSLIVIFAERGSFPTVLGVVALAIVASFVCERAAPYEAAWNRPRRDRARDVAHGVVNETLTVVGIALLPHAAKFVPHIVSWPSELPFAVQVALAVVVLDIGITLVHWQSHHVGWLWRFHAVHHSVSRLYGLNGLMEHPVHQTVETMAGMAVLMLMHVPQPVAVALAAFVVIQLLMQHSNVDYTVGSVDRWLALNRAHRLHHVGQAGAGDVNFGLFLLVWDRLLGTYSAPRVAAVVGDADVGLAGGHEYPDRYVAQLVQPFRHRVRGADGPAPQSVDPSGRHASTLCSSSTTFV